MRFPQNFCDEKKLMETIDCLNPTSAVEVMRLMELVKLVELMEPINAEELMVWITWTLFMD